MHGYYKNVLSVQTKLNHDVKLSRKKGTLSSTNVCTNSVIQIYEIACSKQKTTPKSVYQHNPKFVYNIQKNKSRVKQLATCAVLSIRYKELEFHLRENLDTRYTRKKQPRANRTT